MAVCEEKQNSTRLRIWLISTLFTHASISHPSHPLATLSTPTNLVDLRNPIRKRQDGRPGIFDRPAQRNRLGVSLRARRARNQQDQLPDSIQHRGQHVVTPAPSTLHDEPVDLAEHPRQDGDNDGAAKLSMEETLWRYIPHDSDMARSIRQRSSRIWIIGEGGILRPQDKNQLDFDIVRKLHDVQAPNGSNVLFIQNINLDWCKELCDEYPEALDPDDLAEHVIRFGELPSMKELAQRYPNTRIDMDSSDDIAYIHMAVERAEPKASGFHLDVAIGAPSSEHNRDLHRLLMPDTMSRFRHDVFIRETFRWRRVTSRMTCVRLKDAFCKADAPKDSDTDEEHH
jgi:hypothetical protein